MDDTIYIFKKGKISDYYRNDFNGYFCDFFYGFFSGFSC